MRHVLRSLAALLFAASASASAAPVQVAVAANFTEPARAIAAAFEKATGNQVQLSFGASGMFYTQMTHGAPFEVFLSADADRPKRLDADGLTVPGSRFTYAIGRLVLYSTKPGLIDAHGAVLRGGAFGRIAIADPAAAPYGVAAVAVMTRAGVYAALAPKIVTGTSITQAYQFVATGAAQLGFVALAQVIDVPGGSRWVVPATLHAPIEQQAVLLKTGASDPAAAAFMAFLKGRTAAAIITHYGYQRR